MRTIYFLSIFLPFISSTLLAVPESDFALKCSSFYNTILDDQSAIEKINRFRPKIYIYTDFGGGNNAGNPVIDVQTSGEIASAAWKETIQQEFYINDSAPPLSPQEAAFQLAATFPYNPLLESNIHTIVVHVIDPGVGNGNNPQPRALVLRKDGVLFIGPDNGTLTLACPEGSIAGIWEIAPDRLTRLSGIDVNAGGTFHGRDLFSEAAFRIAAGMLSLEEIGIPYSHLELRNRLNLPLQTAKKPLEFATVNTQRFMDDFAMENSEQLFEKAFLLGVIQSPLFGENALTQAKKLFVFANPKIAIVNHKTENIYIGPNNGLGTSFFKDYSSKDFEVFEISAKILDAIKNETNNEKVYLLIKKQPIFTGKLEEVDFLGEKVVRDPIGRPQELQAKIWVDQYGNIKTTVSSEVLNEAKNKSAEVKVILQGIEKPVLFADSFAKVPNEQLFLYNGSTGTIGPNPHRSKRYVELTSNGIYRKFGVDFFKKNGKKPQSGQIITFKFEYEG